ncbi:MarR family winged helix-turn-helix transcriptional regulator [Streptoalloteichus hindustanus]|uniref:DNA-binding transcriptional regulator, MarR family n=1 Tax=Streptoalloteichus hindustanus TaxID=2017 RepID=A0A1M5FKT2_STRHI|nr:MarR family transcriptional regulator [Streptoalloteichus hindustanus]SHF91761.1 DNA-binding transcriptional regulator, MarR family [Streptoalloteichus hindustanus]
MDGRRSGSRADQRDPHLVGQVAALLFEVVDRSRRVYGEAVVDEGLTELQWLVLRRLRDESEAPPIGHLVDWLNTEPPTVTALVDRLQARGLVDRRPDPRDRRLRRIHLTDAARDVLAKIDAKASAQSPCRVLGADELATLRDILARMLDRDADQ